ncbi:mesoderm induction early response protein 1 isoform X3 [Schistocerca piceifrons]|uniref:mesoderm induction early response protein 1 isoform X3 n=1 Tax=Schistocerca piceifrons TaxID=274613 RepID=UPI001F5FC40D|nr:mesoderm induction early response protein 1 isoform X3 [Schistocerca piceifrons]
MEVFETSCIQNQMVQEADIREDQFELWRNVGICKAILTLQLIFEGDMPLEELLAMYGYGERDAEGGAGTEVECSVGGGSSAASSSSSEEGGASSSGLRQLYTPNLQPQCGGGGGAVGIGSGGSGAAGGPAPDDDCDYNPQEDEDWRKTIMVGSDYQAGIPEGLCKYDDALPYENEDKLLWEPNALKESEVEDFLVRAQEPSLGAGVSAIPTGAHTRDDEQALYLLLQCGYNVEEALRRRRMNALPPADTMSLWSEEECRNFENGLRTYGKDFHLIQQNKVRTRSVGELVQFYYLWKKTERHDIFANKARLEKKKYTLHPGITDYMDRFLEEQEGHRDRSSSPNINCLIYGDPKRRGSGGTGASSTTDGQTDSAGQDSTGQTSVTAGIAVESSGLAGETGARQDTTVA